MPSFRRRLAGSTRSHTQGGEPRKSMVRRLAEREERAARMFPSVSATRLSWEARVLLATVPPLWLIAHLWRNNMRQVMLLTSQQPGHKRTVAEALFRAHSAHAPTEQDLGTILCCLHVAQSTQHEQRRGPMGPAFMVLHMVEEEVFPATWAFDPCHAAFVDGLALARRTKIVGVQPSGPAEAKPGRRVFNRFCVIAPEDMPACEHCGKARLSTLYRAGMVSYPREARRAVAKSMGVSDSCCCQQCSHCQSEGAHLRCAACPRDRAPRHCDASCQRANWAAHKKTAGHHGTA